MLLFFFSVLHEVMRKQAVLYLKFRPWQSSWRPLLIPEASFNLPRKKSFNYWIDDMQIKVRLLRQSLAYKVEAIMALLMKFNVGITELRTDLGKDDVKVLSVL